MVDMSIKDFKKFIKGDSYMYIRDSHDKLLWEGALSEVPERLWEKNVKSYAPKTKTLKVWHDDKEFAYDLCKRIEYKEYPTLQEVAKMLRHECVGVELYDKEQDAYYMIDVPMKLALIPKEKLDKEYEDEEEWQLLQDNLEEEVVKIEMDYMDSYDPYDPGFFHIYTRGAWNNLCEAELKYGGSKAIYQPVE